MYFREDGTGARWMLLAWLGLVVGCVPPPEELRCRLPPEDAVDQFHGCLQGSGIFGHWVVDDQGLPAYDYAFDALWAIAGGAASLQEE